MIVLVVISPFLSFTKQHGMLDADFDNNEDNQFDTGDADSYFLEQVFQ
jgi:hypothetical protein